MSPSDISIGDSEPDLHSPAPSTNKDKDPLIPDNKETTGPENPADDPKNPFCGFVKQIANDSKVGNPIDPWLAQFLQKSMASPPSKDVLQDICDQYKRPENVANLQVPAVENAVWLAISAKARTKDNLRQKHQDTFIKMMIALTNATDELNKRYMAHHEDDRSRAEWMLSPLAKLKDAIMIGGFHNMQDIIKRRRYDLEYYMPEKYKRLCSDFKSFPPTPTALLGEDIGESVKTMDITNKLTQKLDKNSSSNQQGNPPGGNNFKPHHKKGNGYKNKKPFKNNRGNDNRPTSHNNNAPDNNRGHQQGRNNNSDFRNRGPPKAK